MDIIEVCEDMRASGAGLPASAAQAERNAGASLRTSLIRLKAPAFRGCWSIPAHVI